MTSNYGLEVCPRKELEAVLNPEFKPKPVYLGARGRRQWQNVGTTKPTTGRELSNSKLATELQKKQDFTPEEWDSYGIAEVHQKFAPRQKQKLSRCSEESDKMDLIKSMSTQNYYPQSWHCN